MNLGLTGATGFVGTHLLAQLARDPQHAIHALARNAPSTPFPANVSFFSGDVVSNAGLERAFGGCDAVIHLVGIILETRKQSFEQAHHLGTRNAVRAAKAAGVKRFVLMSALGARADGVSEYQTSKWRAEEEVRQSGMEFVILRPSLIFGPRDGFVSQMVDVMRKAPLIRPVVGHGRYRFRPIYIGDVVNCFVQSLVSDKARNRTIELGGAHELTLEQILDEIAACIGVHKPKFHVPFSLMYFNAGLLQRILSHPPVTTDQLRMMAEGSTCDIRPMQEVFGFEPVGFREGLRKYLCVSR